ncbi:MAG: DNA polymerase ligase N-terminal domain-containing protein [Planctomycetota bacterium]|nr:DNA polymerase ligase N-terminal domain-containing protein [Planctomycetota bacterium]
MERRFSVLKHTLPADQGWHFDVFFEMAEALFSLKLDEAPSLDFVATRQFDHRKKYLDYEGPISGNRGSVTIWDRGKMKGEVQLGEAFTVELFGAKLSGRFTVEPLENKAEEIMAYRVKAL